jgi:hypothetical protein
MSFVSNGGKFKFHTVPNGLLFSTPTQPRISFERLIVGISGSSKQLPILECKKVRIENKAVLIFV